MNTESPKETFVEQQVTHTLEVRGKFFIIEQPRSKLRGIEHPGPSSFRGKPRGIGPAEIEHVPARVCVETGERLFSPETVERIQRTIWGRKQPNRLLETPVFEFAGPTRRSARTR